MEWSSLCFRPTSCIDPTTPSLVEDSNIVAAEGSNEMTTEDSNQSKAKPNEELLVPHHDPHQEPEPTAIRHSCPPLDTIIFCNGVNSVVEVLSFDSEVDWEQTVPPLEAMPSSVGGGRPQHELTPTADQGTPQRRGRFLVWPVGRSGPHLSLPEAMSA
jgi:hypothetical protein